jgi:hypothetical protein
MNDNQMRKSRIVSCLMVTLFSLAAASSSLAYDRWSENGDATNCRSCHGNFRATSYVSLVDGQLWGNLHNIHRNTMLSGDCEACHGSSDFPVMISSSLGGQGLTSIGCMGCHGREGDNGAANPQSPNGRGAGLRQRHQNAGVNDCATCHDDADPANYTPVGEHVLPSYYANPGVDHPNMPTGPCNLDGSENFAGATIGLDNDGDGIYDGDDSDCNGGTAVPVLPSGELLVRNFPNPFNPQTTISYTVDVAGPVRLSVYALDGVLVKVLHAGQMAQGNHSVNWDGTDASGRAVTSGLYLCRLETETGSLSRTMTLVR